MHRPPMLPVSLLTCLVLSSWPGAAAAQVNRCVMPQGQVTYTDRRCVDIGAIDKAPRHQAATHKRIYRGGCPRSMQDLMFEVTSAIDARDVNRLASVYNWTGMGSRASTFVMHRLDRIAQRPLVAVDPLMSSPPREYRPVQPATETVDSTPNVWSVLDEEQPPVSPPSPAQTEVTRLPPPRQRRRVVGLRVEQTLANGSTPSRTTFGLQRHFGCLWITGG